MAAIQKSRTIDSLEDDLRVQSVTVGVLLTVVVAIVILAYCGLTWQRPHRTELVAITLGAVLTAFALARLPVDRIVRSPWREPFFLYWSFVNVVLISVLVVLDGTDESPLALTYLMPLIYVASAYPLGSTIAVCVADVGACLAVGLSDGGDPAMALMLTGMLAAAAYVCVLQSRNRDRQRDALAEMSRTDPLTGVLNRRGFEERLRADLLTGERSALPVALLLLDLDGFKPINDRAGHAAGDELLQWTAERIEASVRPADAVGRLGGDEFAVVAPGVDAHAARDLADRIARALENRIGASIGIADYPTDGTTSDDLHRRADEALYSAKRSRPAQAPPHLASAIAIALAPVRAAAVN
jgi:diguanylate cyclase (GGDEF)-like protein